MLSRFVATLSLVFVAGAAGATTLTFDQNAASSPTSDGAALSDDYGDNVAAASQGGFTYDIGAEGATPDVFLTYPNSTSTWTSSYGDLSNVIYAAGGIPLVIELTAAAGWEVGLLSFDLAGWVTTDYEINSVTVSPAGGTDTVFPSYTVLGDGPTHSTVDLGPGIFASAVTLTVDAVNLGGSSDNVGLDNLTFAQRSTSAVPLPAAAPLLAAALGGLVLAGRRRRVG